MFNIMFFIFFSWRVSNNLIFIMHYAASTSINKTSTIFSVVFPSSFDLNILLKRITYSNKEIRVIVY